MKQHELALITNPTGRQSDVMHLFSLVSMTKLVPGRCGLSTPVGDVHALTGVPRAIAMDATQGDEVPEAGQRVAERPRWPSHAEEQRVVYSEPPWQLATADRCPIGSSAILETRSAHAHTRGKFLAG
jgi:hypothetical protein